MKLVASFLDIIKPLLSFVEKELAAVFRYLNRHYTSLAIVALIIIGTIFFFIQSYICRYNHASYWLWKNRAITKALWFGTVLLILKILLMGVM